ncbi:acyltransferase family protein [Erwinia sp. E_sp_B04_7]|uniref:acyltransferase family protein n=1 Tax=unclassified Erwinia TaxID=2622719 RepID=UPI0030CCC590
MNSRLNGLDLLRSVIMIFGPTFHASMLYSGAWGFDYQLQRNESVVDLLNLTHPFRMGLFFIISGFFSALIITKKGPQHFVESRKKKLIKPTLLAGLITLPLIALEMYFLFEDTDLSDYLSYKHLWFLVVLCQLSLLLMSSPARITRGISGLAQHLNRWSWIGIFALFAAVNCACVVISKVASNTLPSLILDLTELINLIQYTPYFFTGMILYFLNKDISARSALALSAIYFIWYLCSVIFEGQMKLALSLSRVVAVLAMCLAIFYTFKNLKIKDSPAISALSKLALPFYLTHLPILIFLGWVWSESALSKDPVLFLTYAVLLNIVLSFLLSMLIKKSHSMSRLLGLA